VKLPNKERNRMSIKKKVSRRDALKTAGAIAGSSLLASLAGCEKAPSSSKATSGEANRRGSSTNEEYVWISANANLPVFVSRDHPALMTAATELGVKATIAGPNTVDIPGLVAAIEQTAARKPAGMMVVGWDASALVGPINRALESGVPVICVDADVPASKRLAFVGTDWYELGVKQGEEMVKALKGRKGKVGLMGLIEQYIDQEAFRGFRSVAEKAGLTVLEPQQDKGNIGEATRVAAALIQAYPDLVGLAGFDSESGPGIGQSLKESGKAGKIVATCVDGEAQHLSLIKEGVLAAAVCQKRELFTYIGLKALYDAVHSPIRFTGNDHRMSITPIPVKYDTGTYVATKENVELLFNKAKI
jgi:ABC-type sugar transport system substrate-binding protein